MVWNWNHDNVLNSFFCLGRQENEAYHSLLAIFFSLLTVSSLLLPTFLHHQCQSTSFIYLHLTLTSRAATTSSLPPSSQPPVYLDSLHMKPYVSFFLIFLYHGICAQVFFTYICMSIIQMEETEVSPLATDKGAHLSTFKGSSASIKDWSAKAT